MDRISHPTSTPAGLHTDGDPGQAIPATTVIAKTLNDYQEEIVHTIEQSGQTPDQGDRTQLAQAVRKLAATGGGLKNLVINGALHVWQRGTSFAGINEVEVYTADRVAVRGDGSGGAGVASIERQGFAVGQSEVLGATYFLRYQQTTPSTAGGGRIATKLEAIQETAEGQLSVSLYLKSSGSISVTASVVQDFGQSEQIAGASTLSVTSSWQLFQFTVDAPSIAGQSLGTGACLRLELALPTGSPLLDVARIQLERAAVASAFEVRPIALERTLCERYYEKSYEPETPPGTVTQIGAATGEETGFNALTIGTRFRVSKRVTPSVTFRSPTTGVAGVIDWDTPQGVTQMHTQPSRDYTGVPRIANNRTSPTAVLAHWTADAEI